MWGVAVGVVTIAAIAAGLGAYFGNRGVPRAGRSNGCAIRCRAAARGRPGRRRDAAVTSPPPASTTAPTATPPVPADAAAVSAAQKLAGGANASGAKPVSEAAPAAARARGRRAGRLARHPGRASCSTWRRPNSPTTSTSRRSPICGRSSSTSPVRAPPRKRRFSPARFTRRAAALDDAMAAYVEFESRFGGDRRVADAKLRRAAILGRQQRQPKAQAMSLQLLNDVVRDFPGTPQAQLALAEQAADRNRSAGSPRGRSGQQGGWPCGDRDAADRSSSSFPTRPAGDGGAQSAGDDVVVDGSPRRSRARARRHRGARRRQPPDFWFRLGEIYERRLNDPAKAREAYAKVPAEIAALQRRAAEAESEIGIRRSGDRDQGLLISIVPVTTSIEITGSPLPSVACSPPRPPGVAHRQRDVRS